MTYLGVHLMGLTSVTLENQNVGRGFNRSNDPLQTNKALVQAGGRTTGLWYFPTR